MWTALELVSWSPALAAEGGAAGLRRALREAGARHAELGGVIALTDDLRDDEAFPVIPDDPIDEAGWREDWGTAPLKRRWDGLPFLAEYVQRAGRAEGVPVALRHGPLPPSVWLPLRDVFPPETAMPVLPVGISTALGAAGHRRFGRALRAAAEASPKPIAIFVPVRSEVDVAAPLARAVRRGDPEAWQAVLATAAAHPATLALAQVIQGVVTAGGDPLDVSADTRGGAMLRIEPRRREAA